MSERGNTCSNGMLVAFYSDARVSCFASGVFCVGSTSIHSNLLAKGVDVRGGRGSDEHCSADGAAVDDTTAAAVAVRMYVLFSSRAPPPLGHTPVDYAPWPCPPPATSMSTTPLHHLYTSGGFFWCGAAFEDVVLCAVIVVVVVMLRLLIFNFNKDDYVSFLQALDTTLPAVLLLLLLYRLCLSLIYFHSWLFLSSICCCFFCFHMGDALC